MDRSSAPTRSHPDVAETLAAAAPSIADAWVAGAPSGIGPNDLAVLRDEVSTALACVAVRLRDPNTGSPPSLRDHARRCHDAGIDVDELLVALDRLVCIAIDHVGDRCIERPLRDLVACTIRDRTTAERDAVRELATLTTRFASRAAHDVRQPLNAITLHSTLIGASGELDARQRTACERIDRAARDVAALLDVLRTATLSEDLSVAGQRAPLRDTIGRVLESFRAIAASRDVTLRVDAIPDVDVDAMRAHLALVPMLHDAIDRAAAAGPDRSVAIDGAWPADGAAGGCCEVRIRCTGEAMPEPTRRFLAGADTSDPVAPGLQLAREAARQAGGTITFADEAVVVALSARPRSVE